MAEAALGLFLIPQNTVTAARLESFNKVFGRLKVLRKAVLIKPF